jgi:hypothetical protein
MNYDYPAFVPGLPIKRSHWSVDPMQKMCPHITKVIQIKEDENDKQYVSDEKMYAPNIQDYPEYEYLIKLFMKEHDLSTFDRTGIKHIDLRNYSY